ncbi:cleavage and polyadenylation specificity factor subunit 6 isoform X3 [Drosophila grimshawi]|uniref:cleavage and polyadenylation specificity factor subunit 6 isoform X3 n=1 Tax=Drosophila grimshawi TaxID=7222 RepID=UPI000C86E95C|nr:cleavage and polyadenylation specificity factor subunit 6 isoform X3 [Drosophila grimshawi]
MADGVVLDLYAEDLDKDFVGQVKDEFCIKDEFGGDGVDLYDDIGGPTEPATAGGGCGGGTPTGENSSGPGSVDGSSNIGPNGVYHQGSGSQTPTMNRRYQLYVGNLTWWTTDQDISNALREIGVNDLQEVKFFENRANGQSKGFSVISLGSEPSLRTVLDQLPKKEMHGQTVVVTYPSKQALTQFESLQKTRPVPPPQQNGPPRGPAPPNMGGPMPPHPGVPQGGPPGHAPRMNPSMQPGQYRPHMSQVPQVGPNSGPPRMQPPMHQQGGPMGNQQPPPRYPPAQGQWPGQRPGGPRPGPPNGPLQRPPMFQGPMGMPVRGPGPGPDWRRPPMHGGFPPQGPPQGPPHMQGPPRPQMGPGPPPGSGGPHGAPAPHVNPAFFNQPGGPPPHPGMGGPPHGQPGPQPGMNMPPQHGPPPHFAQQGGPRNPWPGPPQGKPPGSFPDPQMGPQLTEVEFEEVMSRNRTVSSSAIARAVSDAAAGEYSSAIETLVTAISLIKQSKVAHDERCKILISSLQDTLHGIEAKSYNRRERSRSRDRSHRSRQRRERSTSRYRERSRERERDRDRERERERDGGYRERSRSRERERQAPDHYRDDSSSRSARPRKSPEPVVAEAAEAPSSKRYYEERERYRSSDRERRDRDRDRERERERDRDRREEHRSRH